MSKNSFYNNPFYQFKKVDHDPNYGISCNYKTIFYTSDFLINKNSKDGIAIWYNENYKIKILKIYSNVFNDLVWYDDRKMLVIQELDFSIINEITHEMLETPVTKDLLEPFIEKLNYFSDSDNEIKDIIKSILFNPHADHYILPEMLKNS